MKDRKWGRIIFISSESAIQIPVEMIHYGVTKTALLGLSRGLAEYCAGTGITVNAILPGPTRSDGVEEFVTKLSGGQTFEAFEKEFFTSIRPTSLIKRFALGFGNLQVQNGLAQRLIFGEDDLFCRVPILRLQAGTFAGYIVETEISSAFPAKQ